MQAEILPSGKRRCHWSAEEKARIVAETLAAGAKVAEVTRKHGITPSRIFAWRREARAKEHGEPAAPGLVKVQVVASHPPVSHPSAPGGGEGARAMIYNGGREVLTLYFNASVDGHQRIAAVDAETVYDAFEANEANSGDEIDPDNLPADFASWRIYTAHAYQCCAVTIYSPKVGLKSHGNF
jgi:Transposase